MHSAGHRCGAWDSYDTGTTMSPIGRIVIFVSDGAKPIGLASVDYIADIKPKSNSNRNKCP